MQRGRVYTLVDKIHNIKWLINSFPEFLCFKEYPPLSLSPLGYSGNSSVSIFFVPVNALAVESLISEILCG